MARWCVRVSECVVVCVVWCGLLCVCVWCVCVSECGFVCVCERVLCE